MTRDQKKRFHRQFLGKKSTKHDYCGSVVKISYAEHIFVAIPAVKKPHQYIYISDHFIIDFFLNSCKIYEMGHQAVVLFHRLGNGQMDK